MTLSGFIEFYQQVLIEHPELKDASLTFLDLMRPDKKAKCVFVHSAWAEKVNFSEKDIIILAPCTCEEAKLIARANTETDVKRPN